jgi:hypothetical protein
MIFIARGPDLQMRGCEEDVSSKDISFTKSACKTKLMFLNGFATLLRRNGIGNTPGSIVAKELYPQEGQLLELWGEQFNHLCHVHYFHSHFYNHFHLLDAANTIVMSFIYQSIRVTEAQYTVIYNPEEISK